MTIALNIIKKEHRSFSQQAIVALAKDLDMEENPKNRRAILLKSIMNEVFEI